MLKYTQIYGHTLKNQVEGIEDDDVVDFFPLSFYRTKKRGDKLICFEWDQGNMAFQFGKDGDRIYVISPTPDAPSEKIIERLADLLRNEGYSVQKK